MRPDQIKFNAAGPAPAADSGSGARGQPLKLLSRVLSDPCPTAAVLGNVAFFDGIRGGRASCLTVRQPGEAETRVVAEKMGTGFFSGTGKQLVLVRK